jgi:ubiquitin-activating enzyme E1
VCGVLSFGVSLYNFVHTECVVCISRMDILIVGMNGVGVETAKNILLATPHSLTVHDQCLVTAADLSSNFFLRPSHVGSRRDAATVPGLQVSMILC